MSRFRPVSHEDRLSLIDHLDELRTRLIVSIAAFVVAFGLSFWQNHLILKVMNSPLPPGHEPTTLSPAEPFMTTVTLAAYAALLLASPVILYQLYAFVLPAFSPEERHITLPILLLIPVLFASGVAFGYLLVLPAAVKFLLSFNADQFTIQIRAREYYSFAALVVLVMGVIFQVPVGMLAAARLGITSADHLRRNRRGAYVLIAIVAAALPGTDPVTMLLEMAPLVVLFELSIVLVAGFGRARAERVAATEEAP